MHFRCLYPFVLLLALAPVAMGQTVADRLRELDRLKAEGLISESVYEKQWNQVLEEALKAPPQPLFASVPRLPRAVPPKRWEVMLAGSWLSLESGDSEAKILQADVSLGYHVTDWLVLTVGGQYLRTEIDDDESDSIGGSLGFDILATPAALIVPYVGAGVSYVTEDLDDPTADDDDWSWEGRAGFRQYMGENVVVKYELAYRKFNDRDLDGLVATVGVGIRF